MNKNWNKQDKLYNFLYTTYNQNLRPIINDIKKDSIMVSALETILYFQINPALWAKLDCKPVKNEYYLAVYSLKNTLPKGFKQILNKYDFHKQESFKQNF